MTDPLFISVISVVGVGFASVVARIEALRRRVDRLSRVEAKIDALLKHSGVQFDPLGDVPTAVRDALSRGEKIEAIRMYREATGAGLKEAKDAIEELQRRSHESR
jgi:Ribosomal protein L7/L12 C-terminal domain